MSTSNQKRGKPGPKPKPDKIGRQRKAVRDYRQRQRERRDYMEKVTSEAERLQEALLKCPLGEITLPLDFVAKTTPETLSNLAAIIEAQQEAEIQQGRRRNKRS